MSLTFLTELFGITTFGRAFLKKCMTSALSRTRKKPRASHAGRYMCTRLKMGSIKVNLNYLGIPLNFDRIDLIQSDKSDQMIDLDRVHLNHFFDLPIKQLPRDILERYCEVSSPDQYNPILPINEKLFERLLSPLKSAKKCFCLKEYTATIELAAHVAEMLAILVWKITPISQNGARITVEFEKGLWGRRFEKLGQEQRVRVLAAFNAISTTQKDLFDSIRTTRRRYFHLWSTSSEKIHSDSLMCFKAASELVKSIFQIEFSETQRGTIKINPLLSDYLRMVADTSKNT
jgi:hypothetical protein